MMDCVSSILSLHLKSWGHWKTGCLEKWLFGCSQRAECDVQVCYSLFPWISSSYMFSFLNPLLSFCFVFPTGIFFFPLMAVYCLTVLQWMEEKLLNVVSSSHNPVLNSGSQEEYRMHPGHVSWTGLAVQFAVFSWGGIG